MPTFAYFAKSPQGEVVRGALEAQGKEAAAAAVRDQGLILISLTQTASANQSMFDRIFNKVGFAEVVRFTRQLSTMVTAGLPLLDGLTILHQQAAPGMRTILISLMKSIEGGTTFSKALSVHPEVFSQIYIQLVKAGETAGALDVVLGQLADTLEKQKEFRSKTRGALIYPGLVICTMVGVGLVMMIFVFPKITQLYTELDVQLPLLTQLLIGVSNLLAGWWWLFLIIGIGLSSAYGAWYRTDTGKRVTDQFLFRIPIIGGLYRKMVLTDFCRAGALLMTAGISMLQILDIIKDALSSIVYRDAMKEITTVVEKGIPLSQALSKYSFFPPILTQMVAVGEETGKLDEVLRKLAHYFETETEQDVKNLVALIEPMVMVILGVGVGVMVLAIILPIYDITNKI